MDASSMSMLWYRSAKPQGKVRQRVQYLRIPSSSYSDLTAARPILDLSHNESARLAVDSLLSRGAEGYQEMLDVEGEVDFLSELEKNYILENGRDGNTADPGADFDDDGYKDLMSLSAGSRSATQCPAVSTDSDPTVAGCDHSSVKDVNWTAPVLGEPSVELYFQSESRAVSMKDLVREFIRKAHMALAIVMDSFSDVELLCDLLEASRKRNVSVHLLLDHLNLNLFVTMWQDLKLNSKNFPKLSVHSVDGQTYCSKTGRKLTGQIAESFIIADWTEVLTGSFSFSWLSWQVHRSLAVLVKGSAVTPFHQEFHRLYSSSTPIPGFVAFMAGPHTPTPHITLCADQNENSGNSKLKSSLTKTDSCWVWTDDAQKSQTKVECNKSANQPPHRQTGTGTQTHTKIPLLLPKPLAQPGAVQSASVEMPKHALTGVSTQHDAKTQAEKNQISLSKTLGQTHVSYHPPLPAGLTVTTTAEERAKTQESKPLHSVNPTHGQHRTACFQSTMKKDSDLDYSHPGAEGLIPQQRNRNRLTQPSGIAAGLNVQWNYSLNVQPKVELQSDNFIPSPSTSQQQAVTGLQFLLTHPHTSGLQHNVSSFETRRQHQLQRQHSFPATETAGMGPQLQSDSELFPPGMRAKLHLRPPPMLNWMLQTHTTRSRLVVRTNSFDATCLARQNTGGPAGWRPVHNMNPTLERSKSLNDRHTGGFKGAGSRT